MKFDLKSDFVPTGDQPQAIEQLVKGLENGEPYQVLLGVTGSGKTFTMANVIARWNKPTLILSHNKTLAAQLYSEFKQFFPENRVEYFVSYYDYYQPEAYIPTTNTYIEKDLSINKEIEKLRLSATSALLSGRNDVIVVSSVSCIYGIGNPQDFRKNIRSVRVGMKISRNHFLHTLVQSLYSRSTGEFIPSTFRVNGDTVDIYLPYLDDTALRVMFFGNEIEEIYTFHPEHGKKIYDFNEFDIYPANLFVTTPETLEKAIVQIEHDLQEQYEFFKKSGLTEEAERLKERVSRDVEMLKELGYCSGIENYSRYLDGRKPGQRPFCLLDYFPENFLLIVDESHVTIPQIKAMYGGDLSRKQILVEHGFRLPAALDNRPLKFEEFMGMIKQAIFVSATPADFELQLTEGVIVEQLIRPTGIPDPEIIVRPCKNQVDDLVGEIRRTVEKKGRVLVTTLTKRMAEELSKYLNKLNIRCHYLHSDIDTLERIEILRQLREGIVDVVVGINLLREGLDLPEVSLVGILDADKEGFLRNLTSLIQTIGRAARNVEGRVILYADKWTDSIKKAVDETERRRKIQMEYNLKHGIVPEPARKKELLNPVMSGVKENKTFYVEPEYMSIAADPMIKFLNVNELNNLILEYRDKMMKAAKNEEYMEAARLRDEIKILEKLIHEKS
ncbi:MAG: excinuclease ABC subunit UvrB [Bacteroidia bacterium]|nr:excinuclease ABC subunit UvrB [Bacteroidia bacterium]